MTIAAATTGRIERAIHFWKSTIGKKVVMALTGLVLGGFVFVHMLGNLQIYLGREAINEYAASLASMPVLVWAIRIVLLVALVLHVVAMVQLWRARSVARPVSYRRWKAVRSGVSSRTMILTGLGLLAFIVYHLLHFTTGHAHPDFVRGDVHRNMMVSFSHAPVAIAYVVAMLLLGSHLVHGVWSLFRSLGLGHPTWSNLIRKIATVFAALVVAGNVSMPLLIFFGVVS